jgi:hypothetical protein
MLRPHTRLCPRVFRVRNEERGKESRSDSLRAGLPTTSSVIGRWSVVINHV